VLMDDNFATVVTAAVWGRTVNENIQKFLQFQLSVNFSGVLLTFIGSALSPSNREPLQPVQLLWLNLIMDTLAALCLATETPAPDVLTKPGAAPISRASPIITHRMWFFVFGHGVWQLGMVITLLYLGPWVFDVGPCGPQDYGGKDVDGRCVGGTVHETALFNVYIWLQLFNLFNARKLHGELNAFEGMQRSRPFLAILLVCFAFQFCAVQFFGRFMSTVPLDVRQWFICIGFAASEFLVGFLLNMVPIPSWAPKSRVDNKKGLDPAKRKAIDEAIASAGMVALASADGATSPSRGPRDRWAYAIGGILSTQRALKAMEGASVPTRRIGSVVWRRRDSSLLSFRSHHPAAHGTGIRIV